MKVLFDQGTPAPRRLALHGHRVETAYERGWANLTNGELIAAAEAAGFEVLVTTDQNLKHQQNLVGRNLHIVVLLTTSWPRIQGSLPAVVEAVAQAVKGGDVEVAIGSS